MHRPKARQDLEYTARDGEEVVFVHDPVRSQYFRFNVFQGHLLRAMDGTRTIAELTNQLSEHFEVEVEAAQCARFVAQARGLGLLDISSYQLNTLRVRRAIQRAFRQRGFRLRARPRTTRHTAEGELFGAAVAQLGVLDLNAAVSSLASVLHHNPRNLRAKELRDLVQRVYLQLSGTTSIEVKTIPLFNPERMLAFLSRNIGRHVFGAPGVLLCLLSAVLSIYWSSQLSFAGVRITAIDVLLGLTLRILIEGPMHEVLGHGFACTYYGGRVREVGVIVLYRLYVSFYCDTSSSYLITSKRSKIVIQSAGLLASLVTLAGLLGVLSVLHPSVACYPALVAWLISVLATFGSNVIPFIKFDGYYALCDFLEVHNLRERSFSYVRDALASGLLGLSRPVQPSLTPRERRIFILYAALGIPVTALLIVALLHKLVFSPLIDAFQGSGLILALAITALLFGRTVALSTWSAAQLLLRERRAVFTLGRSSLVLGGAVAFALVLATATLPVDAQQRSPTDAANQWKVRTAVGGTLAEVLVADGQPVQKGSTLARVHDTRLQRRLQFAEDNLAEVRALRARLGATHGTEDVRAPKDRLRLSPLDADGLGDLLRSQLDLERDVDEARRQLALLEVSSPVDGVVLAPHLAAHVGRQLKAGDELLVVARPNDTATQASRLRATRWLRGELELWYWSLR